MGNTGIATRKEFPRSLTNAWPTIQLPLSMSGANHIHMLTHTARDRAKHGDGLNLQGEL